MMSSTPNTVRYTTIEQRLVCIYCTYIYACSSAFSLKSEDMTWWAILTLLEDYDVENLVPLTPPALYTGLVLFCSSAPKYWLIWIWSCMAGPVELRGASFLTFVVSPCCMMHGLVAIIRSPTWKKRTCTDPQRRENSMFYRCGLWALRHQQY